MVAVPSNKKNECSHVMSPGDSTVSCSPSVFCSVAMDGPVVLVENLGVSVVQAVSQSVSVVPADVKEADRYCR